jgi:hypothetical protein
VFVQHDELWGQPCVGYNVQLSLPAACLDALAQQQTALTSLVPLPLALVPASAQHVSLYALLHVRWQHADKPARYRELRAEAHELLADACSATPPFMLRFASLHVTPSAIIARAVHDEFIAALRARLSALLARHGLPVRRYDMVHTTLARFRRSGELSADVVAQVEATPLALAAEISAVQLVCERVYPSLVLETLHEWGLD